MRARARSAIGLAMLLACCACAFALDPSLDISQYAHTSWKIREGFTKGYINSIAQTPDGYLWLATQFGLVRFDGVRTVPFQTQGNQLPSNRVLRLLAARDGTLWIGTFKGLASWKDGTLTQYPDLGGYAVNRLLQDREGTIWASSIGTRNGNGKLCAIQPGSVHCVGDDGSLGTGPRGLYEDSKGTLWVGVVDGLWRWKPGSAKFYSLPGLPNGIRALAEDDDGSLLIAMSDGIRRLVGEKTELAYPISGNGESFEAQRMLRDSEGSVWITTIRNGLIHLHQGKIDVFTQADGLSGAVPFDLFEDREGNLWVSTIDGLDRFRDLAVPTLTANQGLSNTVVESVLADRDGSVWLATNRGLNRWSRGQVTSYGKSNGNQKPDGLLNGKIPDSLFQDSHGRIWGSTISAIGYLENDRFVPVATTTRGVVTAITEDATGSIWIADLELGLLHLQQGKVVQQISSAALGHPEGITALAPDRSHGGLWLSFFSGGVAYFSDGAIRARYSSANGLGEGVVPYLRVDADGTLWAATEGGLSRLKDGRIATLTSKNGLPCDGVHWMVEDDDHSFWMYMPCSLVRIAGSELKGWAAAVDKDPNAKPMVQVAALDSSDGVQPRPIGGGYFPQVTKSADGRLWFVAQSGASVIDPRHIRVNKLPPPVHIEQITADRKTYDVTPDSNEKVHLPPRIRDLEIEYTALSLVAAEKVLFRYKLEGFDRDWQDAGTRRQAFYTNLAPRNYTFRVKACNNSGVWNEAGTSLNFSVAPAYYQSIWFRSLCVLAFLALLAALYQMRLRHLQRQFAMTIEARVGERMRIARELHDTLLQSFQGVLMKFETAADMLPAKVADAQKILETTTVQARKAITEGRDAVSGLRASTTVTNELARAIRTLGEELAAVPSENGNCVDFHVFVEGASKDMVPLIRDEIYRLACEALRNAFKHARATRIEVELSYEPRKFRMRVSDNGKGIEPKVLTEGGVSGHFGLPGMQERARLVKSKLTVRSAPASGTEIELTIPATVAYAKSQGPHASTSSAKEPDVSGSNL